MPSPADREDPLEPLLRRALQGQRAVAEGCLDAETLAAVVDGRLPAEAADAAEAHVSDCARCQATLAALVRSEPETQPRVSWWRLPAVRWLVPATAVAAAAALWVAVDRDPQVLHVRQPVPEVSVPAAPVAPPVATLGDTAPDPAAGAVPDRDRMAVARPRAPVAPTLRANEVAGGLPPPPAERPTQGGPPATTPAAPAAPAASPLAAHQTVPRLPAANPEASRATAFAPPRPVAGVSPDASVRGDTDPAARPATLQAPAVVAEAVMVTRDITSSDPRYRWRLVGRGVQRSTDGGGTWQNQTTGTTAILSAGSAVSPEVCWLVGGQGLVLVTVDGLSWQRVSAPVEEELVAVSATSADAVTVTTRGGRSFATVDRGRTWTAK